MEKEWWASCIEGDPCTLSFKFSPMLSMLLSVEELELLVIRHVFENRLHFLAFVPHLSLNFVLSSSSHGSNPSSYRHIFNAVLCRCLIFHSFYFSSRTENVPKHPSTLKFMKLSFQWAIICMKRVPNQESCANFTPAIQYVQGWFKTAQCSMVLPYLIVQVFKIDDSLCVGNKVLRSFWKLNFLSLYISEHVLKSWWKQQLPSQAL
jgi:hypothetical protein